MSSRIFGLDESRNVSTRSTEWHGWARVPEQGQQMSTVDQIMDFSKAGFPVLQEPRIWRGQEIEGQFDNYTVIEGNEPGTIRNVHLGTVGSKYVPKSNRDFVKTFEQPLASGDLNFETCGTLDNLKKFFVCMSFGSPIEIIPNDPIYRVVIGLNGHDGLTAASIGVSNIRVVCYNTWQAALKSKVAEFFHGRHTAGLDVLLATWVEMLDFENRQFIDEAEQMKLLASKQLTGTMFDDFVKATFNGKRVITPELIKSFEDERIDKIEALNRALANSDDKLVKKIQTDRLAATKEALERLMYEGAGTDVKGVQGSLWGLWNAYSEYTQYERGHGATTTAERFTGIITPGANQNNDLALGYKNILALTR